MKRRLIPWGRGRPARKLLSHAGLIALGLLLGCAKKEKEVICTETCCSAVKSRYKQITELQSAEADYANGAFWLKIPIKGVNGVLVCDLSTEMVKDLPITFDASNIPNSPFAYRVSGIVYHHLNATTLNGDPLLFFKIESIEKSK